MVEVPDKTRITSIFVIDPEAKRIGIAYDYELHGEYPGASHFIVYDLRQGKTRPELGNFYKGDGLHPFSNRQALLENRESWSCANLSLDKFTSNPLTGFLTQHRIKIPEMLNPFIPAKRILAGWDSGYNLMLIYWNESLAPAGITGFDPYMGQDGVVNTFPEHFSFSPGGDWLKILLQVEEYNREKVTELVFYRIAPKMTDIHSNPIQGGLTTAVNPGAFMKHRIWGTCYVEKDLRFPYKLLIFKLGESF